VAWSCQGYRCGAVSAAARACPSGGESGSQLKTVAPEPALAASRIHLKQQASAVGNPLTLRLQWQPENRYFG
jgi:hypothetical protein